MESENLYLIKCADGRLAPSVIVCRHLMDGLSTEWRRAPSESGEVNDWLCPRCYAAPWDVPLDDLCLVCLHCARTMRAAARKAGGHRRKRRRGV